jgi:alginate O-acetyltransferase complex protein AlgI
MSITDILIFAFAALFIRLVLSNVGRSWLIFLLSVLAVFWLQPETPIRYLSYWFPVCTLLLVIFVWRLVTPKQVRRTPSNWIALASIILILAIIPLSRQITYEGILTASRPPPISLVIPVVLGLSLVLFLSASLLQKNDRLKGTAVWIIILIFLGLKIPWLAEHISIWLHQAIHQPAAQAAASDLRWLGFSYIAFRLLHVLRDTQRGRLEPVSLPEFVSYVLFFPSLTAGPIDRLERFTQDLHQPTTRSAGEIGEGTRRLAIGLFKKFVLADTLAIFALNPLNASQVQQTGWSWLMLYAYSFQIYLDFSGYTDIAIGIGRYLGIKLPENFQQPYLQQSLTTFWNNWHMTLTNWFRAYFFNPVTRSLRRTGKLSPAAILFSTQLATMILIGFWHGVTWNFIAWGAWHGLGLYFQNRWSDWFRSKKERILLNSHQRIASEGINIFLTFHFITLGWVGFVSSDMQQALAFFGKLVGIF